jgi:hypothetical protein
MRQQCHHLRDIWLIAIQLDRMFADAKQVARLPVTRVQPAQQGLQQDHIANATEANDERMEWFSHAKRCLTLSTWIDGNGPPTVLPTPCLKLTARQSFPPELRPTEGNKPGIPLQAHRLLMSAISCEISRFAKSRS